jgi:hypothetical protein
LGTHHSRPAILTVSTHPLPFPNRVCKPAAGSLESEEPGLVAGEQQRTGIGLQNLAQVLHQ